MGKRGARRAAHTPLGYAWEKYHNGQKFFRIQDYPRATLCFENALNAFIQLSDKEGEATCCSALAAAYGNNNMYEFALPFAQKAINLFESLGRQEKVASQRQSLALIYLGCEQTEQAEQCYQQVIDEFENIKYFEEAGRNAHTLANMLAHRQELDQARRHFHRAIGLYYQVPREEVEYTQAVALMQLAFLEKLSGDYDASKLLYTEALEIFERHQSYWEVGSCYEGLAIAEYSTGAPHVAVVHAKTALDVFQQHGFREDALRARINYQAVQIAIEDWCAQHQNDDT
ncbi:hypothetical protein ACN08Z_02780 [Rothia sp. P7181]|uniref:hypothetical protein n=1 Tax=unclassified Rothia (in: high G+C Gram-positive bacteria) TaxID=2689056 RepID=UPI003AC240E5